MGIHDAIAEIRDLADQHGLAVSIVTADDVLLRKGIEEPTDAQRADVRGSYE